MKNEIKTTHELSLTIPQTIHKVKNEVIRKYENNVTFGLVPKSYGTLSAFENICITNDLVIEVLMERYDFDIFCDYDTGNVIDLRMLRLPCGDFIIRVYVSLTVETCKELLEIDKEKNKKVEISKEIIVRNRSLHTITSISELDLIITNYQNFMYASNRDSLILFIEVKSDMLEKTTECFWWCQFSTKFEMTMQLIYENSASDIFIYDVEIRKKSKNIKEWDKMTENKKPEISIDKEEGIRGLEVCLRAVEYEYDYLYNYVMYRSGLNENISNGFVGLGQGIKNLRLYLANNIKIKK